jgi:hypothetical protein
MEVMEDCITAKISYEYECHACHSLHEIKVKDFSMDKEMEGRKSIITQCQECYRVIKVLKPIN